MNKLTKVGVTALCGSLATVVSAQAGTLAVTGGSTMSWISKENAVTGTPLGMATGLTFSGSGELDNGTTFTTTIGYTHKAAYTGSSVAATIPGLGTLTYDEGGGTGLDRYDDVMPTAWEEADGTGLGVGLQTVAGAGGNQDIEWALDAGILPEGMSAYISYAPRVSNPKNSNKSGSGDQGGNDTGDGWDLALKHTGLMDGLAVYAGISTIEQKNVAVTTVGGDKTEWMAGATYAIGSVTLGYQHSVSKLNTNVSGNVSLYENDAYAVSFNVNDDLSLSYGIHKSDQTSFGSTSTEMEVKSLQMSYTAGGATITIAESDVDNALYSSATTNDRGATTIQLSLAF